jgi:hypothetical protein
MTHKLCQLLEVRKVLACFYGLPDTFMLVCMALNHFSFTFFSTFVASIFIANNQQLSDTELLVLCYHGDYR